MDGLTVRGIRELLIDTMTASWTEVEAEKQGQSREMTEAD